MTVETMHVMRDDEVRDKVWLPPSTLDTPEPPEGYSYRWVRDSIQGADDTTNIINRERQHYVVVRPEEVKGWKAPTSKHGKYGACIKVGDLILMKVPNYVVEQRLRYQSARTAALQQAVDQNLMKFQSDIMPISKKGTTTRVTTGRANFDDDAE